MHASSALAFVLFVTIAVPATATTLVGQVPVVLRLVDQSAAEIPGSRIQIAGTTYVSGTTASLAIGSHTALLIPGLGGADGSGWLYRETTLDVTASTTELGFEWITANVHLRVQDQFGVAMAGSTIGTYGFATYVPNGTTRTFPVNDPSVYSGLHGGAAAGYRLVLTAASGGSYVGLARETAPMVVSPATTEFAFEWITADVRLRVHDQYGVDMPGSTIGMFPLPAYVANGSTIALPVNDPAVYPTLLGSPATGYVFVLTATSGGTYVGLARETERRVVSSATTEFAFEWITADVRLRVHDQYGVDIASSTIGMFPLPAYVATGAVLTLPVNDPAIYPVLYGAPADGYEFVLTTAVGGHNLGGHLVRTSDHNVVTPTTTEFGFEWIVNECALRIVDGAGGSVPGSTVVLPAPLPSPTPPTVRFPVTENSVYPTLYGDWADGYPIELRPGDTTATGTFAFEALAAGGWSPSTVVIGGATYSLVCQGNRPPEADAGPNVSILSSAVPATTIAGTATDPDSDPLTYRWLHDAAVVFGPALVGPTGSAPLPLAAVPLGVGVHTLTLEVSDQQSSATSTTIVTIGDSPPSVSCTGAGTYEIGTAVLLHASFADYDGGTISWQWSDGATTLASGITFAGAGGAPTPLPDLALSTGAAPGSLGLGSHALTLTVSDGLHPPTTCSAEIVVQDTGAPTLAPTSSTSMLWPPNGAMVDIVIHANAHDASGGPVVLTVNVSSSEDPLKNGTGHTIPDWTEPVVDPLTGRIDLQLRAERSGKGPGRTYVVAITATDAALNASTAEVRILAPHDRGGP